MIKREYSNYFVTSGNASTQEISISFKQENADLSYNPNDIERKYEQIKESFDVAAVVMTLENARQLAEQLSALVTSIIQQHQEIKNGTSVSGS